MKGGQEQYQSAILRIPQLHDCIPDPVRLLSDSTNGQVNNSIQIHGIYFSKDPISSFDSKGETSALVEVGDIVPIEFIDGVVRFGTPKGEKREYLPLQFVSQKLEEQDKFINKGEIRSKMKGRGITQLGDLSSDVPDSSTIKVATHLSTGRIIENGNIPTDLLTQWSTKTERFGRQPVLFLEDIYDDFLSLNQAFKLNFGYDIEITDSYRSYNDQVTMKRKKTNQGKPKEASTPGTSRHGWGLAFDFNTFSPNGGEGKFEGEHYKWMKQNAPIYGFHNPPWAQQGGSTPEAHHFEWIRMEEIIDMRDQELKNEAE